MRPFGEAMMMKTAQETVRHLRSGEASVEDICRLLHDDSIVVRANALEVLVDHARHEEGLLDKIHEAATSPGNKARLMGTITVAHVAVACLMRVGSDRAIEAARGLIASWPELDRSDLLWYLKSEGLATQDPQGQDPQGHAQR